MVEYGGRLWALFDVLPEKYRERFREIYRGHPAKDGYGATSTCALVHAAFDDAADRRLSDTEVLAYLVLRLDERVVFLEKHCAQLVQNQTFAGFTVPLNEGGKDDADR